jgi:hypothetical protein
MRGWYFAALSITMMNASFPVDAQVPSGSKPLGRNGAMSLVIGHGSASSAWFTDLYRHPSGRIAPDEGLGGLALSLRFLRKNAASTSKLRLGGEIGLFSIMSGDAVSGSGGSCGPGCTFTSPPGNPPDDAGIHLGALGSVNVLSGTGAALRLETGAGFVFFNLNSAGPAEKQNFAIKYNTGTGYYTSKPGPAPYVSIRLVPSFALVRSRAAGAALTIDPYFDVLNAFGTAGVRFVSFGGSLSFVW